MTDGSTSCQVTEPPPSWEKKHVYSLPPSGEATHVTPASPWPTGQTAIVELLSVSVDARPFIRHPTSNTCHSGASSRARSVPITLASHGFGGTRRIETITVDSPPLAS